MIYVDESKMVSKSWKRIKKIIIPRELKKLKVNRIEELITVMGLSYATPYWIKQSLMSMDKYRVPLEKLFGTRDDIFTYLCNQGCDRKKAYELMTSITKKRGLTEKQHQELSRIGVEKWALEILRDGGYLFPRSSIIYLIYQYGY